MAHPVPSKSLPILIRQFHGDIAIGPFLAIDIEFGITMGEEEQVGFYFTEFQMNLVLTLYIVHHLDLPTAIDNVYLQIVDTHLEDGPSSRGVTAQVSHVGFPVLAVLLFEFLGFFTYLLIEDVFCCGDAKLLVFHQGLHNLSIAREFGGKGYRTAMGGAGHDPALV